MEQTQIPTGMLLQKAVKVRTDILEMVAEAKSGHPGGSLSAVEVLVALFFYKMRHDPKRPDWPDRDRFVLSKGHAAPVLFATLAESGYFPVSELKTLRKLNSRLQGHPDLRVPGVEFPGGSLGIGLSAAIGMALAGKLDKKGYRVYALLGDGEMDEGETWEAAMAASKFKLDNLTAIVDRNGIQQDGLTEQIMPIEPLGYKWKAFNWHVLEVDGFDLRQVIDALEKAESMRNRPTVIIAHTVKGKGVSFMEWDPAYHGKAPDKDTVRKLVEHMRQE
ncbi:MAG TPA: transketolase [Candidatus Bathyarchaeia archaeon]